MNIQPEKNARVQAWNPEKQNLQQTIKAESVNHAGQVKVNFFTDPLCCWSWAFEKHWRLFLQSHPEIECCYVMCGMIADWKTYSDPLNSVSRPIQMGPVWMHAAEITNTKMKYSVWHEDPPQSSYPPCIAVKAAGLQSSAAEYELLYQLRKALMEEGKNISKPEVILDVARHLTADQYSFKQFEKDWISGAGKEPFRQDLQNAKYHNIGRYPSLTFTGSRSVGVMIVGYRPYESLQQAYEKFVDEL